MEKSLTTTNQAWGSSLAPWSCEEEIRRGLESTEPAGRRIHPSNIPGMFIFIHIAGKIRSLTEALFFVRTISQVVRWEGQWVHNRSLLQQVGATWAQRLPYKFTIKNYTGARRRVILIQHTSFGVVLIIHFLCYQDTSSLFRFTKLRFSLYFVFYLFFPRDFVQRRICPLCCR